MKKKFIDLSIAKEFFNQPDNSPEKAGNRLWTKAFLTLTMLLFLILFTHNATATNPGDYNKDGNIDLKDAILPLQVMTGQSPAEAVYGSADINGDGKIGLEEVIYILQTLASANGEITISQDILSAHPDVKIILDDLSDEDEAAIASLLYGEKNIARLLKQLAFASRMTDVSISQLINDIKSDDRIASDLSKYANMEYQSAAMFFMLDSITGGDAIKEKIIDLVNTNDSCTVMANAVLSFIYWCDVINEDNATNKETFATADAAIKRYLAGNSDEQGLVDELVHTDGILTDNLTLKYPGYYSNLKDALDDILIYDATAETKRFIRSIMTYLVEEHSRSFRTDRDYSLKENGINVNTAVYQAYLWDAARSYHSMQECLRAVWHYKYLLGKGLSGEDILEKKPIIIRDGNALRSIAVVDFEKKFSETWRVNNYDEIKNTGDLAKNYVEKNFLTYLVSYTHNPPGVVSFATATDKDKPYTLELSYDIIGFDRNNVFVVVKNEDSAVRGTNYLSNGLPSLVVHLKEQADKIGADNIMMLIAGANQNACQYETARDLALIKPIFMGRKPQPDAITVTSLDTALDSGVTAIDDSKHYTDDPLNVDNYRAYLAFVTNHLIFKHSNKFTTMDDEIKVYQYNEWIEAWFDILRNS